MLSERLIMNLLTRILPAALFLGAAAMLAYGISVHEAVGDAASSDPARVASNNATSSTLESAGVSRDAWSVFRRTLDAIPGDDRGETQFRLAGTFFLFNAESDEGGEERGAILDDVEANEQHAVREGQTFRDYEVARIFSERVILRRDGEEIELALSFKGGDTRGGSGYRPDSGAEVKLEDYEEVLESNRFGKRIGENRWVISQQALFDYYDELMDNPERIEPVYRALAPERNEAGDITGYRYNKEGEDVLYEAAGIQEGDIVRRVNSMNMISQRRAEYFIGEFIQGRMGAVVLDIERDGVEQKMIYLLR
jgi:type II secretory pathway component PulC